jgi:hypothetical protein
MNEWLRIVDHGERAEYVGDPKDPSLHGNGGLPEVTEIAGAVGALVMAAHDFRGGRGATQRLQDFGSDLRVALDRCSVGSRELPASSAQPPPR